MLSPEQPIGVFDSGIGGLTVLKALGESLPGESFVYLGDTARYPYGPKGKDTIIRYAKECAHFLLEQNVKLVVVACNTASSLALETLSELLPVGVVGTVKQATKNALAATRSHRIGVIGTEATIRSGVYDKSLRHLNPKVQVYSAACPLFVPIVEQGLFRGELTEKVIEHHLSELRVHNIDTLLLGCTHYPMLSQAIQDFWKSELSVVECSSSIAEEVDTLLGRGLLRNEDGQQSTHYYVTDDGERFEHLARMFLQHSSVRAEHVELQEVVSEGLSLVRQGC